MNPVRNKHHVLISSDTDSGIPTSGGLLDENNDGYPISNIGYRRLM